MNSKDKGVWGQFDYQRTVAQIAKKFGLWKPPLPTQATMSQRAEATIVAFSWKQWVWEIRSKKQSTILDVLDGAATKRMEPPPHPPEAGLWGTSPSGSPTPPTYSWKQTDFRFPASNLNPVSKQLQVYTEWTAQPGVSTAGTNTQE